jgi:hypothetical protein
MLFIYLFEGKPPTPSSIIPRKAGLQAGAALGL